jgi:putative SOS response-associated peptidase YedK
MCGRFILVSKIDNILTRFEISKGAADWQPRYNIAPTQPCLTVVSENHARKIMAMSWGLIPNWSKDTSTAFQFFNARAESLREKPSFKESFQFRRCLVPATGFYEWKKLSGNKIPYKIGLKDEGLFAFAGLWDKVINCNGDSVYTFTIITTTANDLTYSLHDRMPVILRPEEESVWINEDVHNEDILDNVLKPYPSDLMKIEEVSPLVNSWKNDTPDVLIKPKKIE